MRRLLTYLPPFNILAPVSVPIILIGLSLIWRFLFIQYIPFSFYHDELDYIFTGQSLAKLGTDVSGNWSPWRLRPLLTFNQTAELSAWFHSFFYNFFYESVLWGRVPVAIFGLGSVAAIIALLTVITKKWSIGLWAGAFLASSPWHIFISRSGFEAGISLFFQLILLVIVFVFLSRQSIGSRLTRLKLTGLAFVYAGAFFFSFFTYHGAKFTVLAFSAITVLLVLLSKHSWKLKLGAVAFVATCSILCVGWIVYQTQIGVYGQRQGELLFSRVRIMELYSQDRATALTYDGLPPLRLVSSNPVSVALLALLKQYASAFDIHRLFFTGYEGTFQFSLAVHSYFMVTGLVTIPVGWWWLWTHRRQETLWLLAFFIVSPITTAISTSTQSIFRSASTYAILMAISGVGAWVMCNFVLGQTKKMRWNNAVVCVFTGIFIAETLWFGARYFTAYPVVAIDNHDFEYRLLSNYLSRLEAKGKPDQTPVVVQKNVWLVARAYLAYSGKVTQVSEIERAAFAQVDTGKLDMLGYSFQLECSDLERREVQIVHPDLYLECQNKSREEAILTGRNTPPTTMAESQQPTKITLTGLSSPVDSRTYYWVLNDPVCADYDKPLFTTVGSFSKYRFEELSDQEFCEAWMKREER